MKAANVKLLDHELNLEEWKSVFDTHCVDEKVRLFTPISKAKKSYCLKTKDLRTLQPEKWYKTIYGLANINDCPNYIPPADATECPAERLQQAFIRPW